MNAVEMEVEKTPPPLERFSAEKFRQWLANMVSDKPPSTQTDRDQMREAVIAFLAACPMKYGFDDRTTMWEKIGKSARAAIDTCDGELEKWIGEIGRQIDPDGDNSPDEKEWHAAIMGLCDRPEWWKVECLRDLPKLMLASLSFAQKRWEAYKEAKGTQYKGNRDTPSKARQVVDRALAEQDENYRKMLRDMVGGDADGNE